jgi:hypothetical protein
MHVHEHAHGLEHVHEHGLEHVHEHGLVQVHEHGLVQVHEHGLVHVHVHGLVHVHVFAHIHVHIYTYIYVIRCSKILFRFTEFLTKFCQNEIWPWRKRKFCKILSTFSFMMKQNNFILGKPYPHTRVAACLDPFLQKFCSN